LPALGNVDAWVIDLHEGGPRNGVLTAVRISSKRSIAPAASWASLTGSVSGVVFALDARWSGGVADAVLPYHDNKLLRSLEGNRLRDYLRVIELQDAAMQQNLAA